MTAPVIYFDTTAIQRHDKSGYGDHEIFERLNIHTHTHTHTHTQEDGGL